ncbi:MAG: MoaD/ThiS family protein [Anaerosomatales bacterium]|uniref:MoaD/ThiS family protein n=1 Tax=Parvivirga hydrogeniphila TaxID=2939460 RepID=UPI002260A87F|nr:MoaD/ThiS family protein [Parvivirga hydrogeniphila]MCL4079408.1 MoaD/ThiS family protein [Parvivirga hydrogeniphila]MDI6691750.1 MoaD/ThiS family protein [Anaerosomatales bacterium]
MRIELALFASLRRFLPTGEAGHERTIDLPDGTTVGQVIATLGLPDEPRVVFVNGRHAPDDFVLHDGDRLAVFPPVAGG